MAKESISYLNTSNKMSCFLFLLRCLTCFRQLSTWPVSGTPSKRIVIVPQMKDTQLDKVADKWVVPGCNPEEADCNPLERRRSLYRLRHHRVHVSWDEQLLRPMNKGVSF